MKKSLFLIAPVAFMSVFSCGKNPNNEISLADAQKKANAYADRLKEDHKAKSATITGNVNEFSWDGTFDIRLADGQHFSITTPFQVNINNQKLTDLHLPYNDIDSLFEGNKMHLMSAGSGLAGKSYSYNNAWMYIPIYLTRFAVNDHFLKLLDGFVINHEYQEYHQAEFDWDKYYISKPWGDCMQVKYYELGDKLKITMHSDNLVNFASELVTRFAERFPPILDKTDAPIKTDITITTDDIGYVDSASIKASCDRLNVNYISPTNDVYIKINGSLKVDADLKISHEYREPIKKFKFLTNEYALNDEGEYYIKSTIDATDNLEAFRKYFTVEWYKTDDDSFASLGKYGDPIFDKWYWLDIDRNIAYQDEAYDVVIIPSHEPITTSQREFIPNYTVFCSMLTDRSTDDELTTVTKNGQVLAYFDPSKKGGKEKISNAVPYIPTTASTAITDRYKFPQEFTLEDGEVIELEIDCLTIHIPASEISKVDDNFVIVLSLIEMPKE